MHGQRQGLPAGGRGAPSTLPCEQDTLIDALIDATMAPVDASLAPGSQPLDGDGEQAAAAASGRLRWLVMVGHAVTGSGVR